MPECWQRESHGYQRRTRDAARRQRRKQRREAQVASVHVSLRALDAARVYLEAQRGDANGQPANGEGIHGVGRIDDVLSRGPGRTMALMQGPHRWLWI